jgi:hypothetical protein
VPPRIKTAPHFRDLIPHRFKLARHNSSLALNLAPSAIDQPSLGYSNLHQEAAENPHSPIRLYRHNRKVGDPYFLLCILCSYALTGVLVWVGADRLYAGLRLSGWCLVGAALILECWPVRAGLSAAFPGTGEGVCMTANNTASAKHFMAETIHFPSGQTERQGLCRVRTFHGMRTTRL